MSILNFGLAVPLALDGSFLVSGGEVLVKFSVYQVVAQDPAGAPVLAIGPPFDPRRRLFVYEDVAAANEVFSFSVVRAASRVHQNAGETGFDDFQRVDGGHDHAPPGRSEDVSGRRGGRGQRLWVV